MKDEMTLQLMNTEFYIAVPKQQHVNWKEQVENWLRYVATEWSRFRDDNALAQVNRLPVGKTLQLSPTLYECLQRAHHYYVITNGLFSPYLKTQLEQHGYKQSLEKTKATSQPASTIDAPLQQLEPFEFLGDDVIRKIADVQVELGGFAKGFAVEKTVQLLQQFGFTEYGIVDGGGDMMMWSAGDKEWTISIADPYDSEKEVSFLKMKSGAIATSNRLYRCWTQGSTYKHHILNGQTGEVASTDIVQASFVTSSLCDAEVGTKMSFLLPENEQDRWFSQYFGKTARFIIKEDEPGQWLLTKGETQHAI